MRVAIMQPYFLPYIGYFQLIDSVDRFVLYDNIKYTKKGWITRNRFLQNGQDSLFSLALRKDSDFLQIYERHIAADFDRQKFQNQLAQAYRKAPHSAAVMDLLARIMAYQETDLFDFIYHSLRLVCAELALGDKFVVSSTIAADHTLKGQDRVLAICEALRADTYINPPGGIDLYHREDFRARGITLQFLQPGKVEYPQFGAAFVPWLSILDVLMFNRRDEIAQLLKQRSFL